MAEKSIEVRSGGHVVLPDGRGIPGTYANCLLFYDDETAQPIRIEPIPIVYPEIRPTTSGQQDDSNTGEAPPSAQGQESEGQS